jgi:hypothetical protein
MKAGIMEADETTVTRQRFCSNEQTSKKVFSGGHIHGHTDSNVISQASLYFSPILGKKAHNAIPYCKPVWLKPTLTLTHRGCCDNMSQFADSSFKMGKH